MSLQHLHYYSETEEKLNIYSHALGILLSIIASIFLFIKSLDYTIIAAMSFWIYGISQILIFSCSTYYHSQQNPRKRYVANIVDHAMIYVSIAGTYTPFCLIALAGKGGWSLFAIVWVIAIIGMILKIKFTGKFNLLSTLIYLAMGWMVVFYAKSFLESVPAFGIYWLVAGGLAYTLGAVWYLIDKLPLNHAVFHVFILIGSFCHFWAIYTYL